MRKIKVDKLLKLDGDTKYAPVKERILALRESDHRYSLVTDTNFVTAANGWLCKATLTIMDTGEVYTGESFVGLNRGTTIQRNFPVEDASTSAIGRAFAAAGIGIEEAFASYEEMQKASAMAKGTTEAKVAEALDDLTKAIEQHPEKAKAIKAIPKMRKVALDPLEKLAEEDGEVAFITPLEPESVDGPIPPTTISEVAESYQDEDGSMPPPEDEDDGFSVSRAELAADDSPVLTGDWKKRTAEKKEAKREQIKARDEAERQAKTPPRSPQTVEEITGKGVTAHMKEVFVRLMERGVNPFDYPERNTDKKFDEIENAVNRGEDSFRKFVIREWGEKFVNLHSKNLGGDPVTVSEENDLSDIVSDQEITDQRAKESKKSPLILDNGKTVAETIANMNNKYPDTGMPIDPKIERAAKREIAKKETELVVPEIPVNTGGMQPNKNFDSQGRGGTMNENISSVGNKFGAVIAPYEDRQTPSKFMKFATSLVNKGVDLELFETYFERHHLSSDYPSFEALLRNGKESEINEFLNHH